MQDRAIGSHFDERDILHRNFGRFLKSFLSSDKIPLLSLVSGGFGLVSPTASIVCPIHVNGAKRRGTTLLNDLAMFWLTTQLCPLQAPLVHLIAIENVWEVEHFENRISLLSDKFPLRTAETVGTIGWHLSLWDEYVVLPQSTSLELALTEAGDELWFWLLQATHILGLQLRDWNDSHYRQIVFHPSTPLIHQTAAKTLVLWLRAADWLLVEREEARLVVFGQPTALAIFTAT